MKKTSRDPSVAAISVAPPNRAPSGEGDRSTLIDRMEVFVVNPGWRKISFSCAWRLWAAP